MADVFISYSHEDRDFVARMVPALEAEGLSVWWDHTTPPGKTWDDVITRGIEEAKVCIIVWSPHSVGSDWVKEEATIAKDSHKYLPVHIGPEQPPLGFRRIQAADLQDWKGDVQAPQWRMLVVEALKLVRAGARTPVAAPESVTVPPRASETGTGTGTGNTSAARVRTVTGRRRALVLAAAAVLLIAAGWWAWVAWSGKPGPAPRPKPAESVDSYVIKVETTEPNVKAWVELDGSSTALFTWDDVARSTTAKDNLKVLAASTLSAGAHHLMLRCSSIRSRNPHLQWTVFRRGSPPDSKTFTVPDSSVPSTIRCNLVPWKD